MYFVGYILWDTQNTQTQLFFNSIDYIYKQKNILFL
jgi:hypothetical protein